tara:strand:+ start:522 stop:1349 length:828 start_codon:yes stop_codon:yes gene_type:complete
MILSKIKKHFTIVLIRLKQNNVLQKIYKENHPCLHYIYNAFCDIKKKNISSEDAKLFLDCENYRNQLLKNDTLISHDLFGADRSIKISNICKRASSHPLWAQFIFLIIKNIPEPNVFELGTNLGVSGAYILSALKTKRKSELVTMEGIPELCEIASKQFNYQGSEGQYEIIQGLYRDTFAKLVNGKKRFNILFIDGDHQKESTLEYFQKLKSMINMPAIIIFDDINWNYDMQCAWDSIKKDNDVNYSIDLFKLGIIIIDSEKSKKAKHFQLHLSY